jgi:hypothetical protein
MVSHPIALAIKSGRQQISTSFRVQWVDAQAAIASKPAVLRISQRRSYQQVEKANP